jgi:hypothetical protein
MRSLTILTSKSLETSETRIAEELGVGKESFWKYHLMPLAKSDVSPLNK